MVLSPRLLVHCCAYRFGWLRVATENNNLTLCQLIQHGFDFVSVILNRTYLEAAHSGIRIRREELSWPKYHHWQIQRRCNKVNNIIFWWPDAVFTVSFRMFLIDSPIVCGDNLCFHEEGVWEVISCVLPWLKSFRFFMGHLALLKTTGIDFQYDKYTPPCHIMSCTFPVSRQISQRGDDCMQTLHHLSDLVDKLTNWYIWYNWKCLKGKDGKGDTVSALNTLFETLFTLCCTIVS